MKTLTVLPETFTKIISGLIESGITFTAVENKGLIYIEFTGGY